MMDDPSSPGYAHGLFENFGYLILAQVEQLVYLTDSSGKQVSDDLGNAIPTGSVNVRFLDRGGVRNNVPYVLPVVGNTVFMGAVPEVGSLCIVGFRGQGQPIILGFLPHALFNLVASRKTLPTLQEGELFLQASIPDQDIEGADNFFRGASIKLDTYGRVKIEGKEFEVTYGYVLSDEYTSGVSAVDDPVTGNKIFFKEKIAGVVRAIDAAGNIIASCPQSEIHTVGKDEIETISGKWSKTVQAGSQITDPSGNKVEIDVEGNVNLKAPSASVMLSAQANIVSEAGGDWDESIIGKKEIAVGDICVQSIGGKASTYYGDDVDVVQTSPLMPKWEETSLFGKRVIRAGAGVTVETTLPMAPCKVGSDSANEPMVLGNVLLQALTELLLTLTATPPGVGLGNLGAPVPWNPAILVKLEAWKVKYLSVPTTNIVSMKTFTEKGP